MIRLTLFIAEDDDSLVYAILKASPKGVKRGNSAKLLLHDGALLRSGRSISGSRSDPRDGDVPAQSTGDDDAHM
jgi:hypothetical protein